MRIIMGWLAILLTNPYLFLAGLETPVYVYCYTYLLSPLSQNLLLSIMGLWTIARLRFKTQPTQSLHIRQSFCPPLENS